VLAGSTAVEQAARSASIEVPVPFVPSRMDATQEQTDVESFKVLQPVADGFRNYAHKGLEAVQAELLLDKAQLISLSAHEMTVLIGGMRVLDTNYAQT
jgi:catalase-peroxidase